MTTTSSPHRRCAALAALAIAAAFGLIFSLPATEARKVTSHHRRHVLAAAKIPKPCYYFPGNSFSEPTCTPNTDLSSKIPTTGMSGWANPFTRMMLCRNKLREDCGKGAERSQPDADGCVVSDYTGYGGKSEWEKYHAEDEALYGGPQRQGVCFSAEEVSFRLGPDQEFNATRFMPWFKLQAGDPTNTTDYLRARGNCSYTLNSIARVAYSNKCNALNTGFAETKKAVAALKINSDKALKCAAAGCAINVYNGTKAAERYRNAKVGKFQDAYAMCEPSTPHAWTTRLTAQTDGLLFRQYQLCHSDYLQRSKALCEGAILA
ncbi:hypothetical protein HYH02_013906 [Chlamydomonas schloesseri]|uniref:Uncharacterized protein n=1 Tax=Chlamydomonas schloesseri TaxID=2026947 RepID=A0A835VVZ7_9CHLO|nr:hypothetical protein HYH02_013906 [Chlamydomonas schloesseri]|eukprot:KAG2429955.1 hypothetical protein HYH02_013906 [Chlamydomonas schloesseri]